MTAAAMTFEEAIREAGFGRFQIKLMVLCGLGWAADAMEVLLISFVIPAVGKEWNLNASQLGLLGTAIFLGMLVGALVWGRVSDLMGRKVGFISTIAIDSVFGLLSAFSPSFAWLVILRTLTGFGVGGTLPVDYSIFAEYLPPQKRGRYLVLLEAFWALGAVVAAGLAWLIVPRLGWRWLLAVSALPGIIIVFIRREIPESPRYLLVSGKPEQAREVLAKVAAANGRVLPNRPLQPIQSTVQARVTDLLKPNLRLTSLLLWLIWFALSLGYYGTFTWLPRFLGAKMGTLDVYQNAFILALAQLPGYFSAAYLVEEIGRKRTLALYLVASGVFTYLFAAADSLNWLVFMGIWMSFFTLGAWGATYAYTPEAYPTNLRATGMGAASAWTRIAGAMAPWLGAALSSGQFDLVLPLTVFAVAFVIAGLAALGLPHETADLPLADTVPAVGSKGT
jgi:MFS transporter, putative metabolite:H+ symporter